MRIDPSHIHPPLIRQLFGKAEKEQGGEGGGGEEMGMRVAAGAALLHFTGSHLITFLPN